MTLFSFYTHTASLVRSNNWRLQTLSRKIVERQEQKQGYREERFDLSLSRIKSCPFFKDREIN